MFFPEIICMVHLSNFGYLICVPVKMAKQYSQGSRSKKILCLLKERDHANLVSPNGELFIDIHCL